MCHWKGVSISVLIKLSFGYASAFLENKLVTSKYNFYLFWLLIVKKRLQVF